MAKQIFIYQGDQFQVKSTQEFIIVRSIQEKDSKKVKLKDPIVEMGYYNRDKKPFTTYMNEAKRQISFGNWIKVKK